MASISVAAAEILGPHFLDRLSEEDLLPWMRSVVADGWTVDQGAVLLRALHDSYHGDRSRFPSLIDYEVAVNGRGIPDMDLPESAPDRTATLLRRGLAFVWAALHQQNEQLPGMELLGVVSAAPVLMDPDTVTGNMTLHTVRAGEAVWANPERVPSEILICLRSSDCTSALRSRAT